MSTLDMNKVNQYIAHTISEVDLDDGDEFQTLDEVTLQAQKYTDRHGQNYGIFKLVAYTEQGPPKATVTVI